MGSSGCKDRATLARTLALICHGPRNFADFKSYAIHFIFINNIVQGLFIQLLTTFLECEECP